MPYSRAFGRRFGFPSYSWTGWKFNARYPDAVEHTNYIPVIGNPDRVLARIPKERILCSWIIWHCIFQDGQTFRLSESGRLFKALSLKVGRSATQC